jgi:hypothetical protein
MLIKLVILIRKVERSLLSDQFIALLLGCIVPIKLKLIIVPTNIFKLKNISI